MELFIPSLALIVLSATILLFVFPKLTPIMLASIAGVALTYAVYHHYMMFGSQYSSMTWVTSIQAMAPYIMVGTVLIFNNGYLLFMAKTGRQATMARIPRLPSSTSATNPVTRVINEGLNAAGNNNARNISRQV